MADKVPLDEKEFLELQEAWDAAFKDTEDFREQRTETIKAYAGYRYSANSSKYKTPMNLLDMFVSTYAQELVPNNPTLMVSTDVADLKYDAYNIQLAANRWGEVNQFGETLRMVVTDALFGLGVVMVGESPTDSPEYDPLMGCVFCEPVQLDDYNYDTTARCWPEISFEGNTFSVDYDEFMESDYYDNTEELAPSDPRATDKSGNTPARSIFSESARHREGFRRIINLTNVYLPRDGLFLTFPADGTWSKPVHWHEWNGPMRGPYHKLKFSIVPGNTMPKSFAAELFDLHDATNRLLNKNVRAAEREKSIVAVMPGGEDDIDRIRKARDGEAVKVSSGQVQETRFGGTSQTTMAMTLALMELFNKRSWNLDLLAGLSAQSPTLGQDQLLSRAATAQVKDMKNEVYAFTAGIYTDVAGYLYNNPAIDIPIIHKMPGYEKVQYTHIWTPEERRGDYLAYNYQINPYSSQTHSPAEQLALLTQFVTQILVPLFPIAQAQGIGLNMKELVRKFGELSNVEGLEDLLTSATVAPPEEQSNAIGDRPARPAVTHRVNERVSRSANTNNDKLGGLMQTLMSGGGEGGGARQMAGLMR